MRPIIATLHRKNKPIWTRHYSRIDSAIPRLTFHMLMDGEPGDVMALSHAVTEWLNESKQERPYRGAHHIKEKQP